MTNMEAIVEFNYAAQEPDELTLRKGDVIKEIKVMQGGWWEGTLRDRRGMFPDNFVKVIESGGAAAASGGAATNAVAPTITDEDDVVALRRRESVPLRNGSGRKWCKVLFTYDPCNEDELTLVPHDWIEYLGEREEGWWKGRLRGVVGVFPSNFVSPPAAEAQEVCKVLFQYEAANEDELTLVEGDIITILSRDAPDRGWWKGELRGQVGLFPDNFVEVLGSKSDQRRSDPDQWHETNHGTTKSNSSTTSSKHSSYTRQRGEKAHARKSLDSRLVHAESSSKKTSVSSSSSTISSSTSQMTTSGDKKSIIGNQTIASNAKRVVNDANVPDGYDSADTGLGEELDGVERGEGGPLSHLTASRAKAPRRRLPSTQLLRHQTSMVNDTDSTISNDISENIANGNSDVGLEQLREDESDAPVGKARRKAPWIEELMHNQMEKRKTIPMDRVDKPETKKERGEAIYPRLSTVGSPMTSGVAPSTQARNPSAKMDHDADDVWPKDKDKSPGGDSNAHLTTHTGPVSPAISPSTTAYVPYRLYSQLLDRVATLEEKQIILQRTVSQLSEQLVQVLANPAINNKV